MTTPDSQARALREPIVRQQQAQEKMREAAREIQRERENGDANKQGEGEE